MEFLQLLHEKCKHFNMHGAVQEIRYGHVPSNDLGKRLEEDPIKSYETEFSASYTNRSVDGQLADLTRSVDMCCFLEFGDARESCFLLIQSMENLRFDLRTVSSSKVYSN